MRKSLVLFLVFIFSLIILINAKPYKPKPILLIHGIDGNSKCWGVSPDTININGIIVKSDSINKDSIIDGRILPVCLEKLLPMVWNWGDMSSERALFSIAILPMIANKARGEGSVLQPALRDLGKYSKCLNKGNNWGQILKIDKS